VATTYCGGAVRAGRAAALVCPGIRRRRALSVMPLRPRNSDRAWCSARCYGTNLADWPLLAADHPTPTRGFLWPRLLRSARMVFDADYVMQRRFADIVHAAHEWQARPDERDQRRGAPVYGPTARLARLNPRAFSARHDPGGVRCRSRTGCPDNRRATTLPDLTVDYTKEDCQQFAAGRSQLSGAQASGWPLSTSRLPAARAVGYYATDPSPTRRVGRASQPPKRSARWLPRHSTARRYRDHAGNTICTFQHVAHGSRNCWPRPANTCAGWIQCSRPATDAERAARLG